MAEFCYNSSYHSSLGFSPFQALYGVKPNFGAMPNLITSSNSEVSDVTAERQAYTEMLKWQLEKAQNRMKLQADRH